MNRFLARRRVELWLVLFIVLQAVAHAFVTENSFSRLALLFSMSEGTLSINPWTNWTNDWAVTPDGRRYSNKPPGPVFMAYPVYRPVDRWLTRGIDAVADRRERRAANVGRIDHWLSIVVQAIPLAALFGIVLWGLRASGASDRAVDVCAMAGLFGNTAVIFANTFYGHAVGAWLFVALYLSARSRSFILSGFWLGWLVLSEYTLAVAIPVFLWIVRDELKRRPMAVLLSIVQGALLPGALFALYHNACFGGPFTPAVAFQNPIFVDVKDAPGFWGVFHRFPRPSALYGMLAGGRQGLLWTQPWIFVAAAVGWTSRRRSEPLRQAAELAIGTLLCLLIVIGGFQSWHGGWTAGPRYLSAIFPLFAVVLGHGYDGLSRRAQAAVEAGVAMGVIFAVTAVVICFAPWNETQHVWLFYWGLLGKAGPKRGLLLGVIAAIGALGWTGRRRAAV